MSVARFGWLALLSLAFLVAGCAYAREGTRGGVSTAGLATGPALIVIAPDPVPAADRDGEAYADWSAYLNDFAAAKPAALALRRITPAQWKASGAPAATDGYATAFLRADGEALFHQGMILEPALYQQGAAWATKPGAAAPTADSGYRVIRLGAGSRE